ncbi:Uncharacterised protein [uncultured archaeon]|nr:Uncharacterised protein [uncultured archaeon]
MFRKRKSSADLAALFAFVGIILTGLAIISSATTFDVANKAQISNEYLISSANSGTQSIEQSFEKTALFFGLMNTSKELGEHGGISSEAVLKADSLTPKMYLEQDIPYIAVALCADGSRGCDTSQTKKRMPFVSYGGYNEKVGTATTKYLLIDSKKYAQNIDEVKSGKYKFYALVQVFMLKEGTVTFKVCRGASCSVTETMSATGTKQIIIGGNALGSSGADVNLTVSGSSEDVAVLREIAVSIYDKDVVESANKLLESNANNYQKSVASFTHDGLNFNVGKFSTAFIPSGGGLYGALDQKQGFIRGIAWAPDKITAISPDVFVSSSGIAEEDAEIRYWRMYGFADYFTDTATLESVVKSRLLEKMNERMPNDYSTSSASNCGGGFKCTDGTTDYPRQTFLDALSGGLTDLTSELNAAYKDEGFTWKFSISGGLFTDNNFQNIPHSKIDRSTGTCSYACGESCSTDKDGGESCTTVYCTDTYYTCSEIHTREYFTKNVKILVEITDEKYKYFDSTTNSWEKPKFKFYIELDKVDDNYCRGYYCDTLQAGATLPKNPEPIVPDYP